MLESRFAIHAIPFATAISSLSLAENEKQERCGSGSAACLRSLVLERERRERKGKEREAVGPLGGRGVRDGEGEGWCRTHLM